MRGREFVERLRKLGRERGVEVRVDRKQGKGSHHTIYFGRAKTTIPDLGKELGPGLLHRLCRQLGVDRRDL
jgi:mRNA interferase HicA